ncbi:pilus assembly protein [Hyphomicrobium sp. D-2]|uniref:TadE/TadG family type IV pilus assembly protein n=1 Tax=Hyphomicrobium sp. D-2 TaxID=3041621 RepID=UPI002456840F|nr:pilus assembly protein [Hyphomicrobium sp. D-2]MDH4982251.1 pilus assembly protein [Hyphomicrobium sp. D-2]
MNYLANKFSACASRLARKDDGAVAIMIAFLFVLVAMGAGIAIDYGRTVHAQTKMQAALDSAVLAGARAAEGEQISVAEKMFTTNFDQNAASNVSTAFQSYGDGVFGGTATGVVKTTLAGILGVKQLDVGVLSKAKGVGMGQTDEGVFCILALDKTASQALLLNSGAEIKAPDCEIHVESKANNAAVFNAGTVVESPRICIESTSVLINGNNRPKNLELGCTVDDDPYKGKLEEPSTSKCDFSNMNYNDTNVTLSPGVYCGWINFNGGVKNVTLKPGLYIIKNGGWNALGSWKGEGVTFYFADQSKIQFNGGAKVDVTAPTSGTYKDIVIFEKSGMQRSQLVFNDNDMNFRGMMYLPSRDVTFNGGSKLNNRTMTLIVNTLILNQTKWDLTAAVKDGKSVSAGIKSLHLIE